MQWQELLRERDVPTEQRHGILPATTTCIHKNMVGIRAGRRKVSPARKRDERNLRLRVRAPHGADRR